MSFLPTLIWLGTHLCLWYVMGVIGILPNDSLCIQGIQQSPINIESPILGQALDFDIHYQSVPLAGKDTGYTLQVNVPPGSFVTLEGKPFQLIQYHFHTPSEHQRAGQATAMELHLVHQDEQGALVVIGVWIQIGQANPVIAKIWQQALTTDSDRPSNATVINTASLLPSPTDYLSYSGSLTTSPCSESVHWYLATEPIEISAGQLAAFRQHYPHNARRLQAIHGRQVIRHPAMISALRTPASASPKIAARD